MLPLTTLLRTTAPGPVAPSARPRANDVDGMPRGADSDVVHDWIGQCEGFQVIGPDGRIGVVAHVDGGAGGVGCELSVATGLFVIRAVTVPAEDVAGIDPCRKRVFVRTAWARRIGRRRRFRRPPAAADTA